MNTQVSVPGHIYKPSAWGHEFHMLTQHEALGAGSAGPGKSLVLLWDPIYQMVEEHRRCTDPNHPYPLEPGQSVGWALHLRRIMPMLEHTIQRAHKYFPKIDPGCRWEAKSHTYVFTSGYRYQFGHCKDKDSWMQYHSAEFTHIGYDEAVQFTEEQFNQINTRLRSSDPVLRKSLKIRLMSNPVMTVEEGVNIQVENPHWVRERFVDPAPQGRVEHQKKILMMDGTTHTHRWIYLPARLSDNPDPAFRRSYEERLQTMPKHIREAMLDGNWYMVPGSYYGDSWIPNIHVRKPFKIPADWPQWRSMDWGFKNPGCVHWYAMDPDGDIFVTRELTFQGKDVGQVSREIEEIEREMKVWKSGRSLLRGPADTQLWEERGDIGKTKGEEFAARGIMWTRADKRSRARNAQAVLSRLQDHRNETVPPGLAFFHHCRNALRTIPVIAAHPKNPEVPVDGGEDHWHDSICYGVAYAAGTRLSSPHLDDEDDDMERETGTRRGRWGYGY